MSRLIVFPEHAPHRPELDTAEANAIAEALGRWGIRFERWAPAVPEEADPLVAYAPEIERVRASGYGTIDVVSVAPDTADPAWPEKARAMRSKFRDDHTHTEDEVRCFASGGGAFYLRLGGSVYCVLCAGGDLLSVPAGTVHWFDMGEVPRFTAVRFFQSPGGWVGEFGAAPIASAFPSFDELAGEGARVWNQGAPSAGVEMS